MSEPAIRDIDDVFAKSAELIPAKAPPIEHPGCKILRHDIGSLHDLRKNLFASIGSKVERDAAFFNIMIIETAA